MQTKSNLSFRKKDDEIIIQSNNGNTQSFPNAKSAWHTKDGGISIITAVGNTVHIDKFGIKTY